MKGKEKYKKPGFPDFLKYRGNNVSGMEKNSFERELQKDPFAAGAEEGFSTVDASALRNDMEELEKRLGSRTRNYKHFVWYRIAASAAVLLGLTTIFLLVQKNRPDKIASISENKMVTFDIQQPVAIKDNAPIPAIAQNKEKISEEISQVKADNGYITAGTGKMKTEEKNITDSIDRKADLMIIQAGEQEKAEAVSREIAQPMAARATDDRSKKALADVNRAYDHTIPEPVKGMAAFNRYIERNITRPDTLATGEMVVVLSFIVRLSGVPDSIRVIESPGKQFSDEAKRLLLEGPKWKPATENGVSIEDEARVRIVFK